jgi:hypothetical protein
MFIKLEIAPQTTVDSLSILVNHIGFPSLKQIKIDSKDINIVLGGAFTQNANKSRSNKKPPQRHCFTRSNKNKRLLCTRFLESFGKPLYETQPDDKIAAFFSRCQRIFT